MSIIFLILRPKKWFSNAAQMKVGRWGKKRDWSSNEYRAIRCRCFLEASNKKKFSFQCESVTLDAKLVSRVKQLAGARGDEDEARASSSSFKRVSWRKKKKKKSAGIAITARERHCASSGCPYWGSARRLRGLAEVENCLLMGARATAGNGVISGLRI